MEKHIRLTNLFTGKETTYGDIEELRNGAKGSCDASMERLIDMMVDAYADGRKIDTYEWILGVKLSEAKEGND